LGDDPILSDMEKLILTGLKKSTCFIVLINAEFINNKLCIMELEEAVKSKIVIWILTCNNCFKDWVVDRIKSILNLNSMVLPSYIYFVPLDFSSIMVDDVFTFSSRGNPNESFLRFHSTLGGFLNDLSQLGCAMKQLTLAI
jgi:hypothetical protein